MAPRRRRLQAGHCAWPDVGGAVDAAANCTAAAAQRGAEACRAAHAECRWFAPGSAQPYRVRCHQAPHRDACDTLTQTVAVRGGYLPCPMHDSAHLWPRYCDQDADPTCCETTARTTEVPAPKVGAPLIGFAVVTVALLSLATLPAAPLDKVKPTPA